MQADGVATQEEWASEGHLDTGQVLEAQGAEWIRSWLRLSQRNEPPPTLTGQCCGAMSLRQKPRYERIPERRPEAKKGPGDRGDPEANEDAADKSEGEDKEE